MKALCRFVFILFALYFALTKMFEKTYLKQGRFFWPMVSETPVPCLVLSLGVLAVEGEQRKEGGWEAKSD